MLRSASVPDIGSIFLIPLKGQDFAAGVLIRADGKGRAYGAFFGPKITRYQDVDEARLKPDRAILQCRFGDHGLHSLRWPVIGAVSNWRATDWPLPMFARAHDKPDLRYACEYDDKLNVISEVIRPASEMLDAIHDSQLGSGIVEKRLAQLLA